MHLYGFKPQTRKPAALPTQIGGLAVHFPITLGNAKRDYSLQERVGAATCLCQSLSTVQ